MDRGSDGSHKGKGGGAAAHALTVVREVVRSRQPVNGGEISLDIVVFQKLFKSVQAPTHVTLLIVAKCEKPTKINLN